MEEKQINIWNEAALPGLVLGSVSIIYMVLSMLMGSLAGTGRMAFLIGLLSFLLWAGKLFLCIWLMKFFMLRFSGRNPSADNRKVFRFGMVVALFSALLYSGFDLVYMLYINPDYIGQSFDLIMQQYASMADSSTLEAMENMKSDMPAITFFSQLVWCWLFGTALSSIFSRKIPSDASDPFKNQQ